jgi:hypothetical protein
MSDATLSVILKFKDEASSAIKEAGKSADGLGGKLKGLAVAAAGAAAAYASMRTIESAVSATQELGESVRKLSMQTGLSAEQSSHMIFALHSVGLSAGDAEKGLGIMAKGLLGIVDAETGSISGGKKTADVLQELGIKAFDATGHIRSLDSLIPEVSDHFREMADGSEKTAIAMQLFGRSGKEMIPFLELGSAEMKRMADEADKLGVTLSGENVAQIHQYTLAQREMEQAIEGVKVKIGMALIPALTEGALGMVHFIERNHEAIENFTSGIPGAIEVSIRSVGTLSEGIGAAIEPMGKLIGLSKDLTFAVAALGLTIAIVFPERGLFIAAVAGIMAVHETFAILDSDVQNASDSALTFETAWLRAIDSILDHLQPLARALDDIFTLGLNEITGKSGIATTQIEDAQKALQQKMQEIAGERIDRKTLPLELQSLLAQRPELMGDFQRWMDAAAAGPSPRGTRELPGIGGSSGGGAAGGLSAAEKAAQQGLIDMALAFADFHAATGLGEQDFMALIKMSEDRADMDKRAAQAGIDLKVAQLEAADGGFQLRATYVALAEQAVRSGETIEQATAHMFQGILDKTQSTLDGILNAPTREGTQLQLAIDKLRLQRDLLGRAGGSDDPRAKALDAQIAAIEQEQKIRQDSLAIAKDQAALASGMIQTDMQQMNAARYVTDALISLGATVQRLDSVFGMAAPMDQRTSWIAAYNAYHPNAMMSYASGTDYVPYTGPAMLHRGEQVIPAGRSGGGATYVTFETHVTADAGIGEEQMRRLAMVIREEQQAHLTFARSAGTLPPLGAFSG